MPIYPGSPRFGLGLWNSVAGTVVVEVALFLAGAWVYFQTTRPIGRTGVASIWILLALLLAIYFGDMASGAPPPSVNAIAIVGIAAAVLFTAWSTWADRYREVRS